MLVKLPVKLQLMPVFLVSTSDARVTSDASYSFPVLQFFAVMLR